MLVGVLATLSSLVDVQSAASRLRHLDGRYLGAMFAVNALVLVISTHRWFLLARSAGVQAPWPAFFRISWVSWGISECGPTLVASEWSRYWLLRGRASTVSLAVSQFVDRVSAYAMLVVLAAGVVLAVRPAGWSSTQSVAVVAVLVTTGIVLVAALLRRFRNTVISGGAGFSLTRDLLAKPLPHGLSVLANLLFSVNLMLAAKAVGLPGDGSDVLLLAPLVLFATVSVPSLVSDWGKREAAAVLVLGQIGLAPEESVALSLVYGAVNMASALPGLAGLLGSGARGDSG